MSQEEENINTLMGVTGLSRAEAEALLSSSGGDINQATNQYFQSKSSKPNEKPKPKPSSSTSSSSRVATLSSTNHESDEEDEEEDGQEFFAGGKASGVAIKGPTKTQEVVGGILKKAEETGRKEMEEKSHEDKKQKTSFKGKAYKLGSSETDKSEEVEEMDEDESGDEKETQISLTFWQDGFSIDDGPLRPYDDPANNQFLTDIKAGKIPSEIAHKYGHNLKILVSRRLEEKYIPPKKIIKPFSGAGNRLGSYVPGESTSNESSPAPIAAPTTAVPVTLPSGPSQDDPNKTSIQIRLSDGTRLVLKIALDEPISEIRRFIKLSRASEASRNFVLMTTFPNKELTDETQTIRQASLANSVIVQRYK